MRTLIIRHKKRAALVIREIISITLNVFVMLFVIVLGLAVYAFFNTPPASELESRRAPQTSVIYDRTGTHILYEMHGEENRKILAHDQIPGVMRAATIAAEDDAFYRHHGIDSLSLLRALKNNMQSDEIKQGGSTITQQLARNVFLSREKTFRRKFIEMVLALKIELAYSKDRILDMYLNQIPYGANAYGVEAAAETFFRKKAADLTLDEAAFLAALPKATDYYSPYGDNADRLIRRQKGILKRIGDLGLENSEKVPEALKADTLARVFPRTDPVDAPHFVFYVKQKLEETYGQKETEEGGLRVFTTLDYDKQKLAEKIVSERAAYNLPHYGASNSALVAIDPKNGQILAMVGSLDFFNTGADGEVNVTTRPRQPGSSFKPFVYAKAFEMGYQPETLIADAPTNFGPDGSGRNYVPRNYDGKYHGVLTMRQALEMSLNIPAVKTLKLVGIDNAIEMAHRLGITTLNDRARYGLSLVIGGGEVTLLDETSGFSVFANDGRRNPADPFLKIANADGKVIYTNQPKNMPVLDPEVARKINSVLSDNDARVPIFGPNNLLHIDGKTVAAKTGTTQEWRDAWTVGYTPNIAVGVWVGNNNNRPMKGGADGSFVAAPIWNKFMSQIIDQYPDESFIAYTRAAKYPKSIDPVKSFKITYYKKSSGKKISEEKAKKMNPDKVEARIETAFGPGGDKLSSIIDPVAAGSFIMPN